MAYIQSNGLMTFFNKDLRTLNNYCRAIVGSQIISCRLVPLPKLNCTILWIWELFLYIKINTFTEFKSEIGKILPTTEVKIKSMYSAFCSYLYLPRNNSIFTFSKVSFISRVFSQSLYHIFEPKEGFFFSFWCFDHFTEMGCMKSTICLTVFDSRLCRFCLTEH